MGEVEFPLQDVWAREKGALDGFICGAFLAHSSSLLLDAAIGSTVWLGDLTGELTTFHQEKIGQDVRSRLEGVG